jgi:hypothetical protein
MRRWPTGTKGEGSRLLEQRIFGASKPYTKLTVRQLFYILISKYGYSPTRKFYKLLVYHLVKLRRLNPSLYVKFVDLTRLYILPPMAYGEVELWTEKDSTRNFVEELARRYRVAIQVERGFGSLSMFRDALTRARERNVKKVLYIGDHDPSGLLIERVTAREMGITVERVAITLEQIKKFNPPSRPVNMRDSRAAKYIKRYGSRCWEVESLEPQTFLTIVEDKLKENVPAEFIAEAEFRDRAAEIAKSLTEGLVRMIESEAYSLMRAGIPDEETIRRLTSKFGLQSRGAENHA